MYAVNAAINPNVQPDAPRENGDMTARKVPELTRTPDAKYSMMYLVDPKIRSAYEMLYNYLDVMLPTIQNLIMIIYYYTEGVFTEYILLYKT